MAYRTSRFITVAVALLALTHCTTQQPASDSRRPVLLAIFAHPDDEASVGPVLAKYAASGVDVYLAVATDGRLGAQPHAGIPAGDSLGAARADELRCAASKLGVKPPLLFGLHDQLRMGDGLQAHGAQIAELRQRVRALLEQLQPDAVITWPTSGWTGHPDHRLVHSVVTEVLQSRPWPRAPQLYFPGAPLGRLPESHPLHAASVDPRYLTVEVAVSAQDYARAKEAWLCHASQYTPEQIEQLHQSLVATQQGVAHFQPLTAPTKKRTSLLP